MHLSYQVFADLAEADFPQDRVFQTEYDGVPVLNVAVGQRLDRVDHVQRVGESRRLLGFLRVQRVLLDGPLDDPTYFRYVLRLAVVPGVPVEVVQIIQVFVFDVCEPYTRSVSTGASANYVESVRESHCSGTLALHGIIFDRYAQKEKRE